VRTLLELAKIFLRLDQPRTGKAALASAAAVQSSCMVLVPVLCSRSIALMNPCVCTRTSAMDTYSIACSKHPHETALKLGIARVLELLADTDKALLQYQQVLTLDPSNVEAMACVVGGSDEHMARVPGDHMTSRVQAAHQFYSDQPELALRCYRRLLQMGVYNTEVWNNMGLCCFYSAQVRD